MQEAIIQKLSAHNIKPSLQRLAIYSYLLERKNHPTVDMIYSDLHPSMPTLTFQSNIRTQSPPLNGYFCYIGRIFLIRQKMKREYCTLVSFFLQGKHITLLPGNPVPHHQNDTGSPYSGSYGLPAYRPSVNRLTNPESS